MRATTTSVDLFEYWQENKESRARIDLLEYWGAKNDTSSLLDLFEWWKRASTNENDFDLCQYWQAEALLGNDPNKHYKILSSFWGTSPFRPTFMHELEPNRTHHVREIILLRDPFNDVITQTPLTSFFYYPLEYKDFLHEAQYYELVLLKETQGLKDTLFILSDAKALEGSIDLSFLSLKPEMPLMQTVLFIELQAQHFQSNVFKNLHSLESELKNRFKCKLTIYPLSELPHWHKCYSQVSFFDFNFKKFCALGGASEFLIAQGACPLHTISFAETSSVIPVSSYHGVRLYGA